MAKLQFKSDYGSSPSTLRPLFVFLPGYGVNDQLQSDLGLLTLAADRDALVLPLYGRTDSNSRRWWTGAASCCNFELTGTFADDVTYIVASIQAVIDAGWSVDPKRIYLVGHSNGAFVSFRVASERPDLIAAVWADAGATRDTGDPAYVGGTHVSLLESHGTLDGTVNETTPVAITGGPPGHTTMPVAPAPTHTGTLAAWATFNGCAGSLGAPTVGFADYANAAGNETDRYLWGGCPSDGIVEHWHLVGEGHTPSWKAAGVTAAIDWLLAHGRP